jgi:hypothetical protein
MERKMKKLVLACAMLMATVTVGAACDDKCAVVLKASDGYWNVRATPNGKILGQLLRGDTVSILQVAGSWTRVSIHDSDVAGWISSNSLQVIPCH